MKATLKYICPDFGTVVEKYAVIENNQIPVCIIKQTLPCSQTKKCHEMLLTKIELPDNLKTAESRRILG